MKRLLSFFALGVVAVIAIAATVKISDLPLATNPSTNTYIEIADMSAVTKSAKYPLSNIPNFQKVATNIDGSPIYTYSLVSPITGSNIISVAIDRQTNTWAAGQALPIIMIGTTEQGATGFGAFDIAAVKRTNSFIYGMGAAAFNGAQFKGNIESDDFYGIGDFPFASFTDWGGSSEFYGFGRNPFANGVSTNFSNGIYGFGEAFQSTTLNGCSTLYGMMSSFGSSYINNGQELIAIGNAALSSVNLVDPFDIIAIGRAAGNGLTGTNLQHMVMLGFGAMATNSYDFVFGGDGLPFNYYFPGASANFAGPVSTASTISAGSTNAWNLSGVTNGLPNVQVNSVNYTLQTSQALTILTPLDAGTYMDFSGASRYWSCTLTGAVSLIITNNVANQQGNVLLTGVATNANLTFPSNWIFIGYKPTYLTANKHADLFFKSVGTGDTNIWAYYGEQQ